MNSFGSLLNKIVAKSENSNPIIKIRLTDYPKSLLNRGIRIESGFQAPYADFNSKEIVLNEGYLSLLWSVVYVIYDVASDQLNNAIIVNDKLSQINSNDPDIPYLDK